MTRATTNQLLASVKLDGRRCAAVVEGSRVRVDPERSLDQVVRSGASIPNGLVELDVTEVEFDAPLRPPFLLGCGQNYPSHLAEQGVAAPATPEFFVKAGPTIAAPSAPHILRAEHTAKLDYETELGVVLGQPARDVSAQDALHCVFGYVVVNDLSARDRQMKRPGHSTTGSGKNFDGSARLSTFLVPMGNVRDPQDLRLTTEVNGELRQSDSTANMLFSCAELIALFSQNFTIPAGTILATGTPGGTGLGCDEALGGTGTTPSGCVRARYLEEGDVVVSAIESIGSLTFKITGRE